MNGIKSFLNGIKFWTNKRISEARSDYNETDSTSDTYIKNKPIYKDLIENITSLNLTDKMTKIGDCNIYYIDTDGLYNIANNQQYSVVINHGTPDLRTSEAMSFDGLSGYAVGNTTTSELLSSPKEGDYIIGSAKYNGDIIYIAVYATTSDSWDDDNPLNIQITGPAEVVQTESWFKEAVTDNFMNKNNAEGTGSFALNRDDDYDVGDCAFIEGYRCVASGNYSHAEGSYTKATNGYSHSEGYNATASGYCSHAEGDYTTASGYYSHAEGENTTASGQSSHTEGRQSKSSAQSSHAEGDYTTASEYCSHAEGSYTTASGTNSHTEGSYTTASGVDSHAEGYYASSEGYCSHSEGYYTDAYGQYSHVQGKYNKVDSSNKYADIVGNGTNTSSRSNAETLDWNGNLWTATDVMCGGSSMDSPTHKLSLKANSDHNHDGVYATVSHNHDGAYAAASHNHDGVYAAASHNQSASTITAGAFAGKVTANGTAMASIGEAQFRNIIISTTDLTAGSSSLASGCVYIVYEA